MANRRIIADVARANIILIHFSQDPSFERVSPR